MLKIIRTNSESLEFIELVKHLDKELAERDGDDHAFYDQFNKIDEIKHAIVLYKDHGPIGCGAIKEINADSVEIKRMFILPKERGNRFAIQILTALEQWAVELSYSRCVLETGKKQPEAINLYKKNGYDRIPNYGQYAHIKNSLCFEKILASKS